jgi:hypothetical protein
MDAQEGSRSMKFAMVCEAPADRMIAQHLADRVMLENIPWADGNLDSIRAWCNEVAADGQTRTLEWTAIRHLGNVLGITIRGHFSGEPGLPDARVARRAVLVLQRLLSPDAVFLVRDTDKDTDRQAGLEQARQHFGDTQTKIVIGLAKPEREAWVLAGYVPENDEEKDLLQKQRQTLGFDPCERSEELMAGSDNAAKRSPKRVLHALTSGSANREEQCWAQTPLELLRRRGAENGLQAYLAEVQSRIVPLLTGRADAF